MLPSWRIETLCLVSYCAAEMRNILSLQHSACYVGMSENSGQLSVNKIQNFLKISRMYFRLLALQHAHTLKVLLHCYFYCKCSRRIIKNWHSLTLNEIIVVRSQDRSGAYTSSCNNISNQLNFCIISWSKFILANLIFAHVFQKVSSFAGTYRPLLRSQDSTKLSKLNSAYTPPKLHFNIITCVPLDLTSLVSISLTDRYLTFMSLQSHAFYVQLIFAFRY